MTDSPFRQPAPEVPLSFIVFANAVEQALWEACVVAAMGRDSFVYRADRHWGHTSCGPHVPISEADEVLLAFRARGGKIR